jgi:uncharacterized membrane protein
MNEEVKEYLQPGKKNLILIYILYLGGLLIPILPIIGVVFAYANQNISNLVWQSHYVFAFRTFLFGMAASFVAMITTFIFIGPILYMLILVWFIVRSIVAMQFLLEESPHPNPLTFWIK